MIIESNKTCEMKDIHDELGHLSEYITWATGKAMGLKVTGTFWVCNICVLRKVKMSEVRELAVKNKRLICSFFDICFPSKASLGDKRH